jgi:multiple sugar transport system substrate-binding protein
MPHSSLDRRRLMTTAACGAAAALLGRPRPAGASAAPITIVVNQSPWFEGFRRVVERYEEATGNRVELDVNPFAGSLEKQRAAVRGAQSPFDVLVINNGFFVEMYAGGFLAPLNEIDPSFKLEPEVYTFDDTVYWNVETRKADATTGALMTVPINPNIPLLYYRTDLYEEERLTRPETWDQLIANAKALHGPPRRYGMVQRGTRGAFDVTYDFLPYLWGCGASAATSSVTRRAATTPSSSTGPRRRRRWTTTSSSRRRRGTPRPRASRSRT